MKLLNKAQHERMLANGRHSAESDGSIDHWPVVKLFTPDAGGTWLLSELAELRGKLGLPVVLAVFTSRFRKNEVF